MAALSAAEHAAAHAGAPGRLQSKKVKHRPCADVSCGAALAREAEQLRAALERARAANAAERARVAEKRCAPRHRRRKKRR